MDTGSGPASGTDATASAEANLPHDAPRTTTSCRTTPHGGTKED